MLYLAKHLSRPILYHLKLMYFIRNLFQQTWFLRHFPQRFRNQNRPVSLRFGTVCPYIFELIIDFLEKFFVLLVLVNLSWLCLILNHKFLYSFKFTSIHKIDGFFWTLIFSGHASFLRWFRVSLINIRAPIVSLHYAVICIGIKAFRCHFLSFPKLDGIKAFHYL